MSASNRKDTSKDDAKEESTQRQDSGNNCNNKNIKIVSCSKQVSSNENNTTIQSNCKDKNSGKNVDDEKEQQLASAQEQHERK